MRDSNGKPPTLHDVAVCAKVSKQTISRVINNKGEVSAETRQRVLAAIHELGYQPNTLARSLVTRTSHVIGLAVPNIDQPYYPEIARGVEDAAREHGYSVFLCNAAGSPERELQVIERLRGHRVAGIISFNSRLSDAQIEQAGGGLFPVVLVNREISGAASTIIWPGYETGARLASEHLLSIGRRYLIFLALSRESTVDKVKLRGFQSALDQARVPFAEDRICFAAHSSGRGFHDLVTGGDQAMDSILRSGLAVNGVFATNDLPAIGALRLAQRRGVRVPHDIAFVGFGSSNVSPFTSPSLSTISMPLYEMGITAFRSLLDRISAGAAGDRRSPEPRLVKAPPELIVRGSSVG